MNAPPPVITELPYKGGTCKLWAWNVNGIKSVLRSGTFDVFMKVAKPTIVCISETKVTEKSLELF